MARLPHDFKFQHPPRQGNCRAIARYLLCRAVCSAHCTVSRGRPPRMNPYGFWQLVGCQQRTSTLSDVVRWHYNQEDGRTRLERRPPPPPRLSRMYHYRENRLSTLVTSGSCHPFRVEPRFHFCQIFFYPR